jgi:basic membrane lipoprotein Med (substrate-binding protein (PBP1-ABC) superfamily)
MAIFARLTAAARRNKKTTLIATSSVVAVAIAGVLLDLLASPSPHSITYTNISQNFRVCLLTTTPDPHNTADVWPAVQSATTEAAINAQRISAPAGTPDQLAPYLNSLIAMKCGLIITTGSDLIEPTITVAKTHPHQHFLTTTAGTGLANVGTLPDQPAALTTAVVDAAHGHFTTRN